MLTADNSIEILTFIQSMVAGYLLLYGLIGLFSLKNGKIRNFYFSCIGAAVFILSFALELEPTVGELSSLIVWSFLSLFISDQLPNRSFFFERLYGFGIPTLWFLLAYFSPDSYSIPFQTAYFFQVILVAFIGGHQTYHLQRSSLIGTIKMKQYINWIHWGLLLLVALRLFLPLFIADINTYMFTFHWVFFIYFIGISALITRLTQDIAQTSIALKVEETVNQEDLTKRKLELALKKEQAFLIPDLTIQELATRMQMKASDLSGFFNVKLGMNFNDVINEYRIDEVKRLIADPSTDPKATIMELAYKSGFNSKATFNRIFKQRTGSTPKEYRKASLNK